MIFATNKQESYIVPYARIDFAYAETINNWILLIISSPGDIVHMSPKTMRRCYETVVIHSFAEIAV